ncbi:MAG: DsbA family protein [Stellaceae bacterium]
MRQILSAASLLFCFAAFAPPAYADGDKVPTINAEDHVMGKPDAPVTIVEYGSLACPHCAAFVQEKLPAIRKEWIDTGKAKMVYRDFPTNGAALRAGAVARCAPPDQYFAFIESFFATQERWLLAKDPMAALKGIARLGGMDAATFDRCVDDAKIQDAIVAQATRAKDDYGVDATPTFFFIGPNGRSTRLVGDLPLADFTKALSDALPKS